ncbi:MAG: hypothetical protein P8Y13_16705 [Deinococcales bacterium]
MKRPAKRNPETAGLRRLLRPGPRPWFRRPPAPDPARRQRVDTGEIVTRYVLLSKLRDRALAETHVGEDALSVGDALKATQHFAFSEHYHRRAQGLEAAIQQEVETLAQGHAPGLEQAAEALRTARLRLYGSPDTHTRPEFA